MSLQNAASIVLFSFSSCAFESSPKERKTFFVGIYTAFQCVGKLQVFKSQVITFKCPLDLIKDLKRSVLESFQARLNHLPLFLGVSRCFAYYQYPHQRHTHSPL